MGVLALGHEDYNRSRRQLTGLFFKDLCAETRAAVLARLDRLGRAAPDYRARLDSALARCDALREQRNRTVHSAYVFLDSGGELQGVLRSDITRGPSPDGLQFDQEMLSTSSFDQVIEDLAAIAFELGLLRMQLIHWLPS